MTTRVRILIGVALLVAIGAGVWWWISAGRESTDDAQVDAHITPIASRVGGTVLRVPVEANQEVEAGAVLVEIDQRDFEASSPTPRRRQWRRGQVFRSHRRQRRAMR